MENTLTATPRAHCMIVHAYYPLAETRVQREAEALIDRGYQVDVICLRGADEAAEEEQRGVQIYRVPVTLRKSNRLYVQLLNYLHFFALAMLQLMRLHRRRRYRAVQVHNLPDFLVFCAWLPKLQGVPVILDLHDLMPEFIASRAGRPMTHTLVRLVAWQERLACRFADQVITVTELWRQALIERGMPAHKVSVVMNVADDKVFRRDPARPPGSRNGRFHLFYHGSQTYRYGLDLILRAVDRLRDQLPGLHVTIHGNGSYNEVLVKLAAQLRLGDRVQFSNQFVSVDELPNLIRIADAAIVPYRRDVFTDGILPTKLLEYVALGIPVIAARTPVIATYFDDTMVEYFTPEHVDELAGALVKLHHNPERRAALARNAQAFNTRYNWTQISAEYVDLIETLAAGRTRRLYGARG
ncbi:MAG TPA: glycosyltransferase family 4 protein [Anaerolineae bacterium]|nr:glycosyltransferase family 4 protein [Anaerolineae bacterium]